MGPARLEPTFDLCASTVREPAQNPVSGRCGFARMDNNRHPLAVPGIPADCADNAAFDR
jgi:hypothetical protein